MPSGPCMKASWMAWLTSTAPIGTQPLVNPLASVIMSGVTPNSWAANGCAGAAEAGDHLVENEQDPVPVADLAQALEITARRNQHAGRTGDRLDDHRGDARGIVQRHQPLELIGELARRARGWPREKALRARSCVCGR